MSRCRIQLSGAEDVGPRVAASAAGAGVRLCPLFFWYDSTHICRTDHYLGFVFAKGNVPGGGFPEDSFGQAMHAEISAAARNGSWREAHAAYGTFLLDDRGGPVVGHLRGRRYIEEVALEEKVWKGWKKGSQPVAQ